MSNLIFQKAMFEISPTFRDGSNIGWLMGSSDSILNGYHLRTFRLKFGSSLLRSSGRDDF